MLMYMYAKTPPEFVDLENHFISMALDLWLGGTTIYDVGTPKSREYLGGEEWDVASLRIPSCEEGELCRTLLNGCLTL